MGDPFWHLQGSHYSSNQTAKYQNTPSDVKSFARSERMHRMASGRAGRRAGRHPLPWRSSALRSADDELCRLCFEWPPVQGISATTASQACGDQQVLAAGGDGPPVVLSCVRKIVQHTPWTILSSPKLRIRVQQQYAPRVVRMSCTPSHVLARPALAQLVFKPIAVSATAAPAPAPLPPSQPWRRFRCTMGAGAAGM